MAGSWASEVTLPRDVNVAAMRSTGTPLANGDMVGHTGKIGAAVMAVEAVDLCLGRIVPVIEKLRGALIDREGCSRASGPPAPTPSSPGG